MWAVRKRCPVVCPSVECHVELLILQYTVEAISRLMTLKPSLSRLSKGYITLALRLMIGGFIWSQKIYAVVLAWICQQTSPLVHWMWHDILIARMVKRLGSELRMYYLRPGLPRLRPRYRCRFMKSLCRSLALTTAFNKICEVPVHVWPVDNLLLMSGWLAWNWWKWLWQNNTIFRH